MSAIGFDTASRTGWAYRDRSGLWRVGVCDPTRTLGLQAIIGDAKRCGCTIAAVEDCYLGKNVRTLKKLQDAQTRIVLACEAHGLDVRLIPPQEWQADLGLTGDRDDRKFGAMRIAKILLGKQKIQLTQDMADAVCIADYAERIAAWASERCRRQSWVD